MSQEIIRAVHGDEVADLFRMLGLLDVLLEGHLKCSTCGTAITIDNFRTVARRSGSLVYSCDKEDCFLQFLFLVGTREGE